jgi:radical SAM superfamily enzyme YgiQ (UPF0313 family)
MAARFLVSGIHTIPEYPPIALGLCMAYGKQALINEPSFEISPRLVSNEEELTDVLTSERSNGRRHIFLFSNYLWNTKSNLHLSRLAKLLDPSCITIHGGPDSPAYTEASKTFLERERHVDFIVAGEGEETLKELLEALPFWRGGRVDVQGLRYLSEGTFVATADRLRAPDVNKFPSPYLSGFFDGYDVTKWQSATIETFRGCPYSCTFCDWGSIMGTKVKWFDLDRVAAEIEWVASRKVGTIWIADSNFGIAERDVEIARKICEVKSRTGFPKGLILTYAKNVKSRVIDIVRLMVDAGLQATGIISLQTSDPKTLQVIRRTNIKTSEYKKLRRAFAERNLPLCVELMMALPGSTIEAFKTDLADHFDLPVEVFVHRTVMLTNSPMADPAYQREHRIETDEQNRVIATATMSTADIETASVICRVFQGVHRYGILRYLVRWLQFEKGLNPLDVIHDLVLDKEAHFQYLLLGELIGDASRASNSVVDLVHTLDSFREQARKESLWDALSLQFISWASRKYDFRDEEALNELGRIQARLMPSPGRNFPDFVEMKYDLAQWYAGQLDGHGTALAEYGFGTLQIDDPLHLSDRSISESQLDTPSYAWELESALVLARRKNSQAETTPHALEASGLVSIG